MRFGVDVSRWQGDFNFAKAKAEGVEYAILKAGGGDAGLYKDGKYERNYSECMKQGIPVGAYFFGQAMDIAAAKKEADYFISLLKGKAFKYLVWYDVEAKMLNAKGLDSIVVAFVDRINAAGYKCGIYASESTLKSLCKNAAIAAYPHWTARWSKSQPSLRTDIWQFGGTTNYIRSNKVAGVVCDQNYLLNEALIDGTTPAPTPTPTPTPTPNTSGFILGKYFYKSPHDGKQVDMGYVFNPKFYADHYKDIKDAFGYDDKKLFEHFVTFGMKENIDGRDDYPRQAIANFNCKAYMRNYPALVNEYGTNYPDYYEHYCRFGFGEGKKAI